MGAVQRLATVVIVGLVALSTILVIYLADESNRIEAEEEEQQHAAIERAKANYLSLCLQCHGPAGEGYADGTGYIGMPLNTSLNQTGINDQGTPVSGGMEARATYLSGVIHNGRGLMPAWGEENAGPLNATQIEEMVIFIQHVDWNEVYNEAVEAAGGYPTAPPRETPEPDGEVTATPEEPGTYSIEMVDIAFTQTELTVPANTEITINLVNSGASTHNFTIDELGVASGDYAAGQTGTVTFNTGAPGEYEFYCSIPGHREAGMVGKLIVSDEVPAEAAPAETTGEAPAADESAPAAGASTEFDVSMVDIEFEQVELTAPANSTITINLTNNGASSHNFTIDELEVASGDMAAGETKTITFETGAPGEYVFHCNVPGHTEAGMTGTLIVT